MNVIFDIETGPLPTELIKEILPPFDPASVGAEPGDFDPASVKTGNLKDPAKIAEKVEAAREKHESERLAFAGKLKNGESAYWAGIEEKAALSAITGQVVAIGYGGNKRIKHLAIGGVDECNLLVMFWSQYAKIRREGRKLVGFRCKAFDVPFLVQRSYILRVPVPSSILTATDYLDSTFVDLFEIWNAGNRSFGGQFAGYSTLDTICKACGVAGKFAGDCQGKDFAAKLWSDDPKDRQDACDYLDADIAATEAIAELFGCR